MNLLTQFSVLIVALASAPTRAAQTGVVEGSVAADSAGRHTLPGAGVSIPALHLTTTANFAGEYRISAIAPGRYLVIATAVGLRSVGDSVTIEAGGTTEHDFILATRAIVLDSVVSKAPAARTYISPGLTGFEERSKQGFGHFITEDELRKMDNERMSEALIQHIPGVKIVPGPGGAQNLASGRTFTSGPALLNPSAVPPPCYTAVYVDGTLMYNYGMEEKSPNNNKPGAQFLRPDFSKLPVDQYAGVEFYAGAATYPPWIPRTNTDCGVLLLWTRER